MVVPGEHLLHTLGKLRQVHRWLRPTPLPGHTPQPPGQREAVGGLQVQPGEYGGRLPAARHALDVPQQTRLANAARADDLAVLMLVQEIAERTLRVVAVEEGPRLGDGGTPDERVAVG